MNQGWQCPVCKRVYGPQVTECAECNKKPAVRQSENLRDFLKPIVSSICPYAPIAKSTPYPTVPQPKPEGYRPGLGGMIGDAIRPAKCPFDNSAILGGKWVNE